MGGCVSKTQAVKYDPQMKQEQKQKQEKNQSQSSPPQAEVEDDTFKKQSSSKRALSILFKKEEDEQSVLIKKQGTEEKDIIQKHETSNPSVNAVVSEKQEISRSCEIQNVMIQEVKPGAEQPSLQKLAKDLVGLETSTAASDVSSTKERPHVITEHLNISDPNMSSNTIEAGTVDVAEKGTGVETCIVNDRNENQVKTDDTGAVTKDASSAVKDENLGKKDENSLKSGTALAFIDDKNTTTDVEGKDFDANMQTSRVENNKDENSLKFGTALAFIGDKNTATDVEGKDVDANMQTSHVENNLKNSQESQVKVTIVNDHHNSNVEGKVLGATLRASDNYALNICAENICVSEVQLSPVVGNCASDNIKDETEVVTPSRIGNILAEDDTANEPIVDLNQSSNNVKDETLDAIVPTNGKIVSEDDNASEPSVDVKQSSNNVKDETPIATVPSDGAIVAEDNTANEPIVDVKQSSNNVKDETTVATPPSNENIVAEEYAENEPIVDLKQSSNNVQDADSSIIMPISGSGQGTCTSTKSMDALPVENHHSNSLLANTEEQSLESSKPTVSQPDMATLVNDSKEEASSRSENTNLTHVDDHHSDSVISKTEEKVMESKEASVVESTGSTVSMSIPMLSVVEASVIPKSELQEKSMAEPLQTSKLASDGENQIKNKEKEELDEQVESTGSTVSTYIMPPVVGASVVPKRELVEKSVAEPLETSNLVPEGQNQMKNKEKGELDGQVEELKVNCQADHSVIKAKAETADMEKNDKNANQGNEALGKDIGSSKMNQEELAHSNLVVLEGASKENGTGSPTKLENELVENSKALAVENVEGAPVKDTISIKHDPHSEGVADNHETQVNSSETKQER